MTIIKYLKLIYRPVGGLTVVKNAFMLKRRFSLVETINLILDFVVKIFSRLVRSFLVPSLVGFFAPVRITMPNRLREKAWTADEP